MSVRNDVRLPPRGRGRGRRGGRRDSGRGFAAGDRLAIPRIDEFGIEQPAPARVGARWVGSGRRLGDPNGYHVETLISPRSVLAELGSASARSKARDASATDELGRASGGRSGWSYGYDAGGGGPLKK